MRGPWEHRLKFQFRSWNHILTNLGNDSEKRKRPHSALIEREEGEEIESANDDEFDLNDDDDDNGQPTSKMSRLRSTKTSIQNPVSVMNKTNVNKSQLNQRFVTLILLNLDRHRWQASQFFIYW